MKSEETILGTLLAGEFEDSRTTHIGKLLDDAPDSFDDLRCGEVAWAIRETAGNSGPVNLFAVIRFLNTHNKQIDESYVRQLATDYSTKDICEFEAETLWGKYRQRKVKATFSEAVLAMESKPEATDDILAKMKWTMERLETETSATKPELVLQQRRFDPDKEPPQVEARFTLLKQIVCTPGNLTTITAAVKTGKTAVIGSMIAAAFPHDHDADLLGFNSSNPDRKAIVAIDSEQAPEDHWKLCATATRRAGLEKSPDWLYSYCFAGLDCGQSWRLTLEAIRLAAESHGGIHSIFLDGAADFVADVNDPEQSNRFVATLHGLAIEYHCPIVAVIHYNPGSEKSRGHLGSQLERKAESNLALEKDSDEITVIYSTKQRRAPIPKHTGPRVAYSTDAGMHLSVESKVASKEQLERETLSQLAAEVFQGRSAMRYSEIQSTLKNTLRVSDATADRKLAKFHHLKIIKKSAAGLYALTT